MTNLPKDLEMKDKMRIVQELVPGRQITILHIIANPDPILYQKMVLYIVQMESVIQPIVWEQRDKPLLSHSASE